MYIIWFPTLIKLINNLPGTIHLEDTNRNIFEMITSRGFKYESHFVNNEQGYILQIVRIINPLINDTERIKLKPIILQHGFQTNAKCWLLARDGYMNRTGTYIEKIDGDIEIIDDDTNTGSALGFVLAARGYDVWLGNTRGNPYSTNHTTLNPEETKFWEFALDDLIEFDLPVLIDYVKTKTNRSTLGYIGHSQGSFMMIALLTIRPEYSNSIKPFIAISPVFYTSIDVTMKDLIPLHLFPIVFRRPRRLFGDTKLHRLISNLCENILFKYLCYGFYFITTGTRIHNNFSDRMGVYIDAVYTGSSSWNILQYYQIFKKDGIPQYFDYEDEELNLKKYGQKTPPLYKTSQINSTDIAIIYSKDDLLLSLEKVEMLKENLNVTLMDDYMVPEDMIFAHQDLVQANVTGNFVNKRVLQILSRY